jgi:multidrug efflux pump
VAYFLLPVAPLPQVDYPTISVTASLPGAAPDTMAATVATPLERALGAIAGVNEMTSSSSLGSTRITLQFDLTRTVDSAARDVQAAINAARTLLPSGMPSNPTYRKVNPADAPIMILALTSSLTRGQMYDAASTVLAQKLSQVEGVGQASSAAARCRPCAWSWTRCAGGQRRIAGAGAHRHHQPPTPTAPGRGGARRPLLAGGRQRPGPRGGRLRAAGAALEQRQCRAAADVADVTDSVQDVRNYGVANGKPAVLLQVFKQPAPTSWRPWTCAPAAAAAGLHPAAIDMTVCRPHAHAARLGQGGGERAADRRGAGDHGGVPVPAQRARHADSGRGRAGVADGHLRRDVPGGYTLDNLSLMALTVATGFVVDDAIVVLENVMRHMERGKTALQAALEGAREIGFTVVSMSLSLIAVFVPILFMGGIVGRFFREFAVVMSAAILVSMVSLTTTPMMCAAAAPQQARAGAGRAPGARWDASGCARGHGRGYRRSLAWGLRHQPVVLLVLLAVIGLNVHLYQTIDKGFMPSRTRAASWASSVPTSPRPSRPWSSGIKRFLAIVQAGPGGGVCDRLHRRRQRNAANMFMSLKPWPSARCPRRGHQPPARKAQERARRAPVHDDPERCAHRRAPEHVLLRVHAAGRRYGRAAPWEPRIRQVLSTLPELTDVNSDVQDNGMQTTLVIDRDAATRLGLTVAQIDNTLNDAFGQRQVGVIYNPLNQYRVVMEAAPVPAEPRDAARLLLRQQPGQQVPLTAFARITTSPRRCPSPPERHARQHHQLQPGAGVSLSQANDAIRNAMAELGVPVSMRGSFSGSAGPSSRRWRASRC